MSRRGIAIGLGILWLVDAALQAEASKFARSYPLDTLAQSVMGAPGWLNQSIFDAIHPFVSLWPWWNLAAVLIEVAIGAFLLSGRAPRATLAGSFTWALGIWWLGEGLGLIPSGFALMEAGAPGPALFYIVLGLMAWPIPGRRDTDRRYWMFAWLIIWVGGAFLHVASPFSAKQVLDANLATLADGSPRWLAQTSLWMSHLVGRHAVVVTGVLMVIELVVGLGPVLIPTSERAWIGLGLVVSVFFWVVFQQLGGVLTPDATDPNLAPLVVLLALAAYPLHPVLRARSGRAPLERARLSR